jgi:transposase
MEMMTQVSEMEQKIQSLERLVANQAAQIAKMEILIRYYEEQFKLAQRRRFGSSSQQSPNQLRFENFFNEAEDQADPSLPEPTYEEVTYKRKKRVGKRKEDLSGLPVERVDYELPESERVCPECGEPMRDIGVTIRDELEIVPAQVIHKEHAVHAYACANCEKHNDHTPVLKAEAPTPLISGSLASPSAVAHIATQKYMNGMPLYRQGKGLLYDNVDLSRQTMANWLVYCAQNYLSAIYALMIAFLLKADILHADETTVQVLHEPGRSAQAQSYEWLYRTSGCAEHPVVIYEYQETRKQEHPKAFLKDFKGYLHTDGYPAYHNLPLNITVVGCWFHARQYWENLYKTLPAGKRDGSNAERGLVYINLLFLFEDEFRDLEPEERYKKRLEFSKPVSDEFFAWAGSLNALPKSLLGEAVHYALAQRTYLENVYLDGRLELSNNRAERSIKPFVQGRKQWLFSNTPNGAESSSIIYSIIETAKENHLHPFQYVKYLLEMLPNAKTNDLDSLLPWSANLPDCCRAPVKATQAEPGNRRRPKGPLHNALMRLRERFRERQDNSGDVASLV